MQLQEILRQMEAEQAAAAAEAMAQAQALAGEEEYVVLDHLTQTRPS